MQPYYSQGGIDIYHGDCRDVLPHLPPVELVLTDPPYGMDYHSRIRVDKTRHFDKIANDERPFIWWLQDAYNLTRSPGALVAFCDWRNQESFRWAIETAGYQVRSQLIWDRESFGMGDTATMFAPSHDVAWFAIRGKFRFPGGRPKSILRYAKVPGELLLHPNEKPLSLLVALIRDTSSGSVLDPCMGSGSTLVAAKQLGRQAIGVELEERYCEVAAKRLSQDVFDFREAQDEIR